MQTAPPAHALPFIDEHERVVAAPPEETWAAILHVVRRMTGGGMARRYARFVKCDPAAPDPLFPSEGGAVAGFRVTRSDAPRALSLAGRHRFAHYDLRLLLDPLQDGRATRLRAQTRAAFPGAGGRAYRLAVIGTRAHALAMRRLLGAVARRAARDGRAEA